MEPRDVEARGGVKKRCFGRRYLCERAIDAADEAGLVLLFGSRRSGRTVILREIERTLTQRAKGTETLSIAKRGVYVGASLLGRDAAPADFFKLLAASAASSCNVSQEGHGSVCAHDMQDAVGTLEGCVEYLHGLLTRDPDMDVRLVFLIDDAKRLLMGGFPRSFQDNLFALLYDDDFVTAGRCSVIMAGGQELYQLTEDETSALGSRAIRLLVENLSEEAVHEMVVASGVESSEASDVAEGLYRLVGGQAALTASALRRLPTRSVMRDLPEVARGLENEFALLFRNLDRRLSDEARVAQEQLVVESTVDFASIARALTSRELDAFRVDRAIDELVFSGIARVDGTTVIESNELYCSRVRKYAVSDAREKTGFAVWEGIGEVESGLRKLVRGRYESEWGSEADKKIERALGGEAWGRILTNQRKRKAAYPLTRTEESFDVLEFTYLGQLCALMVWSGAWKMFRHMFRDARQLEDLVRDITPVRNDVAHFRSVSPKEADRCRIAADDLLTIVLRELERG